MTPLILLSILGLAAILCLVLVIRMILGQTSTSTASTQQAMTQFSKAVTDFQEAQTTQLGQVLDRHSSDIRSILERQSDYINRFLNGPIQAPDQPSIQPDQPDAPDPDPGNWTLAQQLANMPKSMREQIEREQAEQTAMDRLLAPSHPIHYDPRVPLIDPSLSSEESVAWVQQMNGSETMSHEREG